MIDFMCRTPIVWFLDIHSHTQHPSQYYNSLAQLSYGRLNNRWFQLEEMEDQDSCTTEVRLNEDLSVEVADTNGPLFTAAEGSWFLSEDDGSFTMTLKRTYEAGQPNTSDATAVGPFSFSLYRTFNGGVGMVGDRASVEGKITDEQTSDKELGVRFFFLSSRVLLLLSPGILF